MDGDFSDIPNSDVSNQHSHDDDELVRDLKKSLIFDNFDGKKRNIYYYDVDEDEEDGDVTEALLVQMGYGKTETKKRPVMTPAPVEEVEEEEEEDVITKESLNQIQMGRPPKHEPPPTPVPADNLKSAMKGSGRKEKSPRKERKVTWAEGVFDKIRVETETHSQKSRHKWGKDKNKSGGKYKERKGGAKGKKFSGSSSKKCIYTPDEEDGTWSLFW